MVLLCFGNLNPGPCFDKKQYLVTKDGVLVLLLHLHLLNVAAEDIEPKELNEVVVITRDVVDAVTVVEMGAVEAVVNAHWEEGAHQPRRSRYTSRGKS